MKKRPSTEPITLPRREFLGATALGAFAAPAIHVQDTRTPARGRPTMVGSRNALPGMQVQWEAFSAGGASLDHAIEVVKVKEADENDMTVGKGGLPNEEGVVALDAAVMHGPTHNSGAVAAIENIVHPSEVARLVMERTDHCLLVGKGAYEFARMHGHPHAELLTEKAREAWVRWLETMSERDDRLVPAPLEKKQKDKKKQKDERGGHVYEIDGERVALEDLFGAKRPTGTIHCSALSKGGHVACTTTTSGLAWKIPGRVGDSPIIGAGLYCDQEAGSAGATGRGESAVLSNGSFAIVELMRQGASPEQAGLEVLRRITRQAQRGAKWQPGLVDEAGVPTFGVKFYVLGLDGTTAGVTLKGGGKYAVADLAGGPRLANLKSLHS